MFPLLIYNGNEKWTAKINVKDLFEETIPQKYIPQFEYYPINKIPPEVLLNINNVVSAIFYLENTNLEEYSKFIDILIKMLHDALPEEIKFFSIWFNSILKEKNLDVSQEDLVKIYKTTERVTMFSANLDEILNKRLEQGIELGVGRGIKKGARNKAIEAGKVAKQNGLSIELTAKITGLTKEEIEKL